MLQATLPSTDYTHRVPICLVAAFLRNGSFDAETLLQKLLPWQDDAMRKPYAPSSLHLLQGVGWLLSGLEKLDSSMAAEVCRVLLTVEPYRTYSARVRADKVNRSKYFPWMQKNGGAYGLHPAASLTAWLDGRAPQAPNGTV